MYPSLFGAAITNMSRLNWDKKGGFKLKKIKQNKFYYLKYLFISNLKYFYISSYLIQYFICYL